MRRNMLIAVLIFTVRSFCQQSYITGEVYDSKTREPLIGVNILVNELKGTGSASDVNGGFNIRVPAGSYSITASYIGYRSVVKTDIVATSANEAHSVIYMEAISMELQQVNIRADYFDKAALNNNISAIALGAEEIKRSPGAAQDFMRILQGMSGVSFSNDQKNELIVRGGSPNENLIVFDNMEIHSTNHFPSSYNSGGRINMVNLDLIEDIHFSTGGFISKYGDKISSVVTINNREGTRFSDLKGNINLSMQSIGAVFEGRINNGKGSWILSARKSFLDLIKNSIGLNTVPEYWDAQVKAAYDFSASQKISFSGLYGNDKVFDDGFSESEYPEKANLTDSTGRSKSDISQSQIAVGINLKSIWSKNLYSLVTIYYSNFHTINFTSEDFLERIIGRNGEVVSSIVLNNRPVYVDKRDNGQAAISSDFIWNINHSNELNFGGRIVTSGYTQDLYQAGDSVRYKNGDDWQVVKEEAVNPAYSIKYFGNYKAGLYFNHKLTFFDGRLFFNAGLRYDYFSYNGKYNFSPRVSATFYIIPENTNLNLSYGEYYQTQLLPVYTDKENTEINRYLESTHATHYIAGIEQIIDDGLKLSVEGYYKAYDKIPVTEKYINYFNHQFRSNKKLNVGSQTVMGIDILVQQKLVKDLYGTLALSFMKSKMKDPRIGKEGDEYPADYDFPQMVTLIIGKRFSGLRSSIELIPNFLRYAVYLLPFSDDMEISLRWRYAAGKPYTPMVFTTDEQIYEGERRWSRGSWVSSDNINSQRIPDYHRLDISFSSRFNFYSKNLTVYLTLENLYNRKNIAGYEYNSDGTIEEENQFSLMPVAGIMFEF